MKPDEDAAFVINDGVRVYEPAEKVGGCWTVKRGDGSYVRVGSDMGRLLVALTSSSSAISPSALVSTLGPPWTVGDVTSALNAAMRLDIVGNGRMCSSSATKNGRLKTKKRGSGRVVFVPPLTVQFTVFRIDRLAGRLRPVLQAVPLGVLCYVVGIVSIIGVIMLALRWTDVVVTLSEPVSLKVALSVAFASFAAITLHELGHGVALIREGEAPSRFGFMFFYLVPAMFCDVSDGWLLRRKQQRVTVALAGVATQALIGGVCSIAAVFSMLTSAGESNDVVISLTLVSVSNYLAVIINLVPLVKLDGYIALMAHLDVPFLRQNALDATRTLALWILFGVRCPVISAFQTQWMVWFGLGCAAFPIVLVALGLGAWESVLAGMGRPGHIILAAAVVYILWLFLRKVVSCVREAKLQNVSWKRLSCGLVAITIGAGAVAAIPVPSRVTGGYVCHDEGSYFIVFNSLDAGKIEGGDLVSLRSRGVLLTREHGATTVASNHEPMPIEAPLSAYVPVSDFDTPEIPSNGIMLSNCPSDAKPTGQAVVQSGSVPLAMHIVRHYFFPLFH